MRSHPAVMKGLLSGKKRKESMSSGEETPAVLPDFHLFLALLKGVDGEVGLLHFGFYGL